jgi:hypothetical protein
LRPKKGGLPAVLPDNKPMVKDRPFLGSTFELEEQAHVGCFVRARHSPDKRNLQAKPWRTLESLKTLN